MKRACIALVDAAHARIFTYSEVPGQDPTFEELEDLVNPGRQSHGYFTEKAPRAPGIGRAVGDRRTGARHGAKDDHRDDHLDELEQRFARDIVRELQTIVREQAFEHLIFVASPKMLSRLREEAEGLSRDIVVDELAQDLAWMTPPQVHDHLAARQLVAPRRGATLRNARLR